MPKYEMSWHRECLANISRNLEIAEDELRSMQRRVDDMRRRHTFYQQQIAEADRRGITAFDQDLLLIKHPTKSTTHD